MKTRSQLFAAGYSGQVFKRPPSFHPTQLRHSPNAIEGGMSHESNKIPITSRRILHALLTVAGLLLNNSRTQNCPSPPKTSSRGGEQKALRWLNLLMAQASRRRMPREPYKNAVCNDDCRAMLSLASLPVAVPPFSLGNGTQFPDDSCLLPFRSSLWHEARDF